MLANTSDPFVAAQPRKSGAPRATSTAAYIGFQEKARPINQDFHTLFVWNGWLLFGALFAVVGYQLLTGRIRTKNLLLGRNRHGDLHFSPGRVQLLVFTMGAALQYLSQVLYDPTKLPEIPPSWLALVGGSHAVYLGGKAYAMLWKDEKTQIRRNT